MRKNGTSLPYDDFVFPSSDLYTAGGKYDLLEKREKFRRKSELRRRAEEKQEKRRLREELDFFRNGGSLDDE